MTQVRAILGSTPVADGVRAGLGPVWRTSPKPCVTRSELSSAQCTLLTVCGQLSVHYQCTSPTQSGSLLPKGWSVANRIATDHTLGVGGVVDSIVLPGYSGRGTQWLRALGESGASWSNRSGHSKGDAADKRIGWAAFEFARPVTFVAGQAGHLSNRLPGDLARRGAWHQQRAAPPSSSMGMEAVRSQ